MMLRTALLLLCGYAVAFAGPGERSIMLRPSETQPVPVTGNVRIDLCGLRSLDAGPIVQQVAQPGSEGHSRKSPWLAAGLSAVVPGAGEFYAQSYWKSAAFFAVEVAALALAYQYDKRGDRQTDSFQDYANQHWSVNKYAQWTLDNAKNINPGVDLTPYSDPSTGVIVNGVVNWAKLNQLESSIGSFYSHVLPPYGDQQYYELIGKYPQFSLGWDDAPINVHPDYESVKASLSPHYLYYGGERGKANTYYDRASTFMLVVLVNHVASALDAAWSASSYNRDLSARMELMTIPVGQTLETVPAVKVTWGL